MGEDIVDRGCLLTLTVDEVVGETKVFLPQALFDDRVQPGEGATDDEQHVRGVDLNELLVRVLASTLGRNRCRCSLEDLQQRLLHTFTADIPGDRRVLALASHLVDLVDVDDAGLRPIDVVVSRLDELEQDVLNILADVPGFGESRRVGDRERHVQNPR